MKITSELKLANSTRMKSTPFCVKRKPQQRFRSMFAIVELPDLQLCKSAPDKIDASLNESTA
jgi:hypothetical protein